MIEMWLMFRRSLCGDLERDQRGAGAQRGQPQPHLHRGQQPARPDHVAGGEQRRGSSIWPPAALHPSAEEAPGPVPVPGLQQCGQLQSGDI